MTPQYQEFLDSKRLTIDSAGVDVPLESIHEYLFPFQRQLVQWTLRKGRSALFADTGLGKTLMQLEWARQLNTPTLIIAPLAVAQQTVTEAKLIELKIQYVRRPEQITEQIVITNYELIDHFDMAQFNAVILDESSILKSVDGKTRTRLISKCQEVEYRLCCTATPAPNDIAEFANHAEFLGICTRQEMLSMFFVNDDDGWRLKGHARTEFYRWMASWAMMIKMPSDIGFEDDGYILPELKVNPAWVEANADGVAQQNGMLFFNGLSGIQGRTAVRKGTIGVKVARAAEMLRDEDQWVVWCGLNDEGREIAKAIPDAVLVEGADSLAHKTDALSGFVDGRHRVLVTKPSIAGFGLNMQNCHNVMFIGLSDSYESYYQAIRRCWRFGQTDSVNVQPILTDLEREIWENLQRKEQQHNETATGLISHVTEFQREELGMTVIQQPQYVEETVTGNGYTMMLGDCVERLREIPDNSVDLSIFSPPFLSLFVYSNSARDMGNSKNEDEFFTQYNMMLAELYRVIKPGRNVACHVAQVASTLNHDGYIGIRDFRGSVIQNSIDAGFVYHGEVVIDKNPQAQAIRTHAKALLFAQLKKDSAWLRPGLADYILIFRKPGENETPIHPDIDNETWIEWAHPIWYGIRESDTLHVAEARAEPDERHVAPLQLGTIERCLRLWSNPGETILSPFAGIGSEGYESILRDRKFIGVELKPEYFKTACKNLERAITKKSQGKMF
jgi:DNA modification methylase